MPVISFNNDLNAFNCSFEYLLSQLILLQTGAGQLINMSGVCLRNPWVPRPQGRIHEIAMANAIEMPCARPRPRLR